MEMRPRRPPSSVSSPPLTSRRHPGLAFPLRRPPSLFLTAVMPCFQILFVSREKAYIEPLHREVRSLSSRWSACRLMYLLGEAQVERHIGVARVLKAGVPGSPKRCGDRNVLDLRKARLDRSW